MREGWIVSLAAACLAVMPAAAMQGDDRSDRDFQWVFREHHGDGTATPTAIFLSWNYSSVIFRASCEELKGSFKLNYYPDSTVGDRNSAGSLIAGPFPPIYLERAGKSLMSQAWVEGDSVEARFMIDDRLFEILQPGAEELNIVAKNPEGDPWFVGQAEPLLQLAKACR